MFYEGKGVQTLPLLSVWYCTTVAVLNSIDVILSFCIIAPLCIISNILIQISETIKSKYLWFIYMDSTYFIQMFSKQHLIANHSALLTGCLFMLTAPICII